MKKVLYILPIILLIIISVNILRINRTPKEEIKIGVVAPLTGSAALWGQGTVDVLNIATDEINANGGIDGRKIRLIVEDGKCQGEPAVTAAKKLIEVDKVKFILGGHCSPETAAIAPILEENKVFGLAGVTTATGILDKYTYAFRTSPTNLAQAKLIAELAYNKYEIKNIAVITEQTVFAKSISADFITAFKEIGGNVVDEEAAVTDQKDFRTELLKIKAQKPDAVFVSPQNPAVGIEIAKEINQLGITAKLTGNTVFIAKKVIDDSGKLLPNNSFTVAPYADPTNPRTKELMEKYKAKYGKDIPYNTFFVGAAYDGMYMLKDAIDKKGEDATKVRDYFFAIKDYQGTTATFNFDKNGDPQINNFVEQRVDNGNLVFEKITK